MLFDVQQRPVRIQETETVVSLLNVAARYPTVPKAESTKDGTAAFWNAMSMGADLNTRVPLDRWDVDQYYSPDLASKKMCAPCNSSAILFNQGGICKCLLRPVCGPVGPIDSSTTHSSAKAFRLQCWQIGHQT